MISKNGLKKALQLYSGIIGLIGVLLLIVVGVASFYAIKDNQYHILILNLGMIGISAALLYSCYVKSLRNVYKIHSKIIRYFWSFVLSHIRSFNR